MPIVAVLHLVIAIGFAAHAMRTGRNQYWLIILLTVPFIGSIAYVLIELLPELASTRRARRVASDITTIVDPNREFRRRHEAAAEVDSAGSKLALAEECERKGMWEDAIALYKTAAQGVFADDPAVLAGLARSQLELGDLVGATASLDRFQAAHPDLKHSAAHLVYARLEEAKGRLEDAAREYEAVSRYFVGLEARTRFGLLQLRRGELQRARALFEEVVRVSRARGIVLTQSDEQWLKVAKANI